MAAAAFLLFAVALVANALRMPSRQMQVERAPADIDGENVAQILAEFLRVPSYASADRFSIDSAAFVQLHEILERRFPQAHQVLKRELINELSLLYSWQGSDTSLQPIVLMSHLDVVPVEKGTVGQWIHETPTVADGFIWGRGALDVKCGVVGIMAAVEHLIQSGFVPQRTVYLAFGHDEEVGGNDGNASIAGRLDQQGVRPAFVLDEGGAILHGIVPGAPRPVAFVAVAEKRMAELRLTALGEGGHGSMPGRSAILNLAQAIVRVNQEPMPVRMTQATDALFDFLGPEMPILQRVIFGNRWLFDDLIAWKFAQSPSTNAVVRSTINVTQLETETMSNQSATLAKCTINARLLPGESVQDVRNHILKVTEGLVLHNGERAISCNFDAPVHRGLVSPTECTEFGTIQRTIHEVFPDVIVAAGLTSVSTDSCWYYGITDKVYRFIPMRVAPEDVERIHGINERIGVANMAEIARFYVQLLRNADARE